MQTAQAHKMYVKHMTGSTILTMYVHWITTKLMAIPRN